MTPSQNPEISLTVQPHGNQPVLPDGLVYRANQMIIDALVATGQRAAHAEAAFLEAGRLAIQDMAAALSQNLYRTLPQVPAMFTRKDLEEFATGLISKCFGPEYAIFEGRRYPRIPNGDLLLMDRVISIIGKRHELAKGAAIVTEFDVSPQAWFYQTGFSNLPPYAVLMEMALQPCGLLSAYLGSSFLLKDVDLYFRNLDGHAEVLAAPDLRGKTVTARAELLSSTLSGRTIIQSHRFSLSCDGQPFFTGESFFGYFSVEGMANQVGLDGKQAIQPQPSFTGAVPAGAISVHLDRSTDGQLGMLDELILLPTAGPQRLGQILARQKIDPRDWFYRCHFHQDPVMPGSLGVEAAIQAIKLFAQHLPPGQEQRLTTSFPTRKAQFTWKYRGQILPIQNEMALKVDIISREAVPGGEIITGNASVWVDSTRIYEFSNLAVSLQPTN